MSEVIPSPNIWNWPERYEIENRCVDPDGRLEATMREIHDWAGARVLDIGCGSGFHLTRFAERAAEVVGVEPHPPLVELARRRVDTYLAAEAAGSPGSPGSPGTGLVLPGRASAPARAARVEVRAGTAQALPVGDEEIDVVHARWAYFFGPGCEPGLAEIRRVLRPGGVAFVIDNDATRSTFGRWFRRALPKYDPVAVERFWSRQGWRRRSLDIRWEMPTREDFESVVRIEFEPELAAQILAEHAGNTVDYAVNLFWYERVPAW